MARNRKALVRLHLKQTDASIEGIARTRRGAPIVEAGHYLLDVAKRVTATESGDTFSVPLDGLTAVPASEVHLAQVTL